jgi:hypothetical protein
MVMDNIIMLREYYENYIVDVVLEISQASYWRGLLFNGEYNKKYLISQSSIDKIPKYIKNLFIDHDLKFYVSKVMDCPIEFDFWLVIFKFEAFEYPDIVHYSGNNDNIV